MHLFLGLSGADHVTEHVKKNLSSQAFWTKRTNLTTGKVEEYLVQGVWRPIEFGHYVFPEEYLNEVLTMLGIGTKDAGVLESPKHIEKYKLVLRKLMGLEKIPELKDLPILTKEQQNARTIFLKEFANIIPIGIKRDGRGPRKFMDGTIWELEWL